MQKPRRRWHVLIAVEGDSWQQCGTAAARAIEILNKGDPHAIEREGKPFHTQQDFGSSGMSLEINHDPKMTPDVYAELMDAWRKFQSEPGA